MVPLPEILLSAPWVLVALAVGAAVLVFRARACSAPEPAIQTCARCTRRCPRVLTRWRLRLAVAGVLGRVLGFVPLFLIETSHCDLGRR